MAEQAPQLLQARIELLTRFRAALAEWHDRNEKPDEENVMFAAVQGPQPPGPEIEEARSFINRNLVAAREAVEEAGVYCTVAGNVGGTLSGLSALTFTEPNEIFGPIDLRRLREGVVETETRGMLPEAEIAFLDEVFLGSTAILNTLLTLLNERVFRRGHSVVNWPLRVCVRASNHLPET